MVRRQRRTLPFSEHWQLVKYLMKHRMISSAKAEDGTKIEFFRCQGCRTIVTEHPSLNLKHLGRNHFLSQPVTLSRWERFKISAGLVPYVS